MEALLQTGVLYLTLVIMIKGHARKSMFHSDHGDSTCSFPPLDRLFVEVCRNLVKDGNHELCIHFRSASATPEVPDVTTAQTPAYVGRLPRSLEPIMYTLEITPYFYGPDPNEFYFKGCVLIEIKCVQTTNQIILNIDKINITDGSVYVVPAEPGDPVFAVHSYFVESSLQLLTINVGKQLQSGKNYTLKMNYTGELEADFAGLYLSSYKDNGIKRHMALTQFSPTYARKAFPCFDEPDRKAMFDITIIRRTEFVSLSNMPVLKHELRDNGMVADIFERTPLIPTHFLAFIVCDLVYASIVTARGLRITSWATEEKINTVFTGLYVGAKTLTYFEDYFQILYPLPKQDMLSVPFTTVPASDNWGLMTFKEANFLYDPLGSPAKDLQTVARHIARGLAQQWFGNLVTLKWWCDDILEDGLATYFEHVALKPSFPEWNMEDMFIVNEYELALKEDGLKTSHPVSMPLASPAEIRQHSDVITRAKGGQLIRMLQFILGEDTLKRGIQRYLSNKMYGNADQDEFWYDLSNQTAIDGRPLDIKAIMDTWTLQMNYPIVKVYRIGPRKIAVEQTRYLQNPNTTYPDTYASPFGYLWKIPFTYTTSLETNFLKTHSDTVWVTGPYTEIEDVSQPTMYNSSNKNANWIIANTQLKVLCRVNYDSDNWYAIIQQLKTDPDRIHHLNRAQIIQDAWSLVRASELDLYVALKVLEYLPKETEYVPWATAAAEFKVLLQNLVLTSSYGNLLRFIRRVTSFLYRKMMTLPSSMLSHSQRLLKGVIAELACRVDTDICITQAQKLFKLWVLNPSINPIEPDLKEAYYCGVVSNGDVDEWDFIYLRYLNSSNAAEKVKLISSLACTNSLWLLSRLLDYSLDEQKINKQDRINVIMKVAENPIGTQIAWNLISTKWEYFLDQYSESMVPLADLLRGVTSTFNTEAQLIQLEHFMRQHKEQNLPQRVLEQALEKTESNVWWIKEHYRRVDTWLQTNKLIYDG